MVHELFPDILLEGVVVLHCGPMQLWLCPQKVHHSRRTGWPSGSPQMTPTKNLGAAVPLCLSFEHASMSTAHTCYTPNSDLMFCRTAQTLSLLFVLFIMSSIPERMLLFNISLLSQPLTSAAFMEREFPDGVFWSGISQLWLQPLSLGPPNIAVSPVLIFPLARITQICWKHSVDKRHLCCTQAAGWSSGRTGHDYLKVEVADSCLWLADQVQSMPAH